MKRIWLISICIVLVFIVVYALTASWVLALLALAIGPIGLAISAPVLFKSKEEQAETEKEFYEHSKKAHEKTTRNNPTLR